ncbi:polysaccharide biosynthesis C-terminal domain-containing protein [bacterium]|nr:polysaccharide biosynthesis C-terminal domain-containing protein [bacterium]
MIDKLKKTVVHTAIYGIGHVATKLVGLVLLPLYARVLTVSDYGILGIIEISITILAQILMLGQPFAYLRLHNFEKDEAHRQSALFTLFSFLFVLGLIVNLAGQMLAAPLATLFNSAQPFELYMRYSLGIVHLQVANMLFFSVLRAKERSLSYAVLYGLKLVVMLLGNVYFVAMADKGLMGVIYAYLIGESITFIILLFMLRHDMKLRFNRAVLMSSIALGAPLIMASLTNMILNMGDRYLLKLLTNYREVGLYNLGYKIAGVLNMLLIQSFNLTFLPMAQKMYGQPGANRYYQKLMSYFVFVMVWAGLGLSLLSRDLLQMLASNPDYWHASAVIPLIVLAFILSGAKGVVNLGLYLKGRTGIIARNMAIAALLNIILNILLIPDLKMMGAAIATTISFAVLLLITNISAQRCYPIPYEWGRLIKLLIWAIICFALVFFLCPQSSTWRIVTGLLITAAFPFTLLIFSFYDEVELVYLKNAVQRISTEITRRVHREEQKK